MQDTKHFSRQGFLRDLYHLDWEKVYLIPDVEIAWDFFYDNFSDSVNKHVPLECYRVKGWNNPWFNQHLSQLLLEHSLS